MKMYWIKHLGDVHGPYSSSELKELINNKTLTPQSEISQDQQLWKKLEMVKGLRLLPVQPTTEKRVVNYPNCDKPHSIQEDTAQDDVGGVQPSTSVSWLQYYREKNLLPWVPSQTFFLLWGIVGVVGSFFTGIIMFILEGIWWAIIPLCATFAIIYGYLWPLFERYIKTITIVFTDSAGTEHSVRLIDTVVHLYFSRAKFKLALLDEELIFMRVTSESVAQFKHATLDFSVFYGSTSKLEQITVKCQGKNFYTNTDTPDVLNEISNHDLSEWPLGPSNDLIDRTAMRIIFWIIRYRPD